MINHIQNKGFCLHNVFTVYIYYVYINTNTCIYLRKIYVYILNIFIYNIKYKNMNI